jgi:trehalose 6-phosphate synthase
VPDALAEKYYNGFSNDILWPLLHYEPGNTPFDPDLWNSYKEANQLFAAEVAKHAGENDLVWVHDYHLMVLPAFLRKRLPKSCSIGWFLHTPFPTSEIFRTLPVRSAVLHSLLQCDLLGFHTFDYSRHFLSSVQRILPDVQVRPMSVTYRGRTSAILANPIGIEPAVFEEMTTSAPCIQRIQELCEEYKGRKLVVSVDRLDPIKGMPTRLQGITHLFETHPELIGEVCFLQIAVPSRQDVQAYRDLRSAIDAETGIINGRYSSLTYQPVRYLFRSVSPADLTALYNAADVCLINSYRDGMNLVASEYCVTQKTSCRPRREGPGVLILSSFAGCAQSLVGAVQCHPWDPRSISAALYTALSMPAQERTERWKHLYASVSEFTSQAWATTFVHAMLKGASTQADGNRGMDASLGATPMSSASLLPSASTTASAVAGTTITAASTATKVTQARSEPGPNDIAAASTALEAYSNAETSNSAPLFGSYSSSMSSQAALQAKETSPEPPGGGNPNV